MARYRKIDPRIWNDEKFRYLSDNGKLAFLFLLTHPHMTSLGAMRATISGLAEELGWTTEAFREAFGEVLQKGMAEHDQSACLIALPNFIKYNNPESPNVIKAWVGALDLLPECPLKTGVIARAKDDAEGFGEAFGKAFPKAFLEALSKGMPYQKQEQKPKQELKQEVKDAPSGTPPSSSASSVKKNTYPPEFEKAWSEYPRNGDTNKAETFKAWNARIKAGATPSAILDGVIRYAAYCRAMRIENIYIKQPSTFFGPNEHFLDDWKISLPPKAASAISGKQAARESYFAQAAAAREKGGGNEIVIDSQCTVVD